MEGAAVGPLTVGRVFVPGGLPTVTYNPRAELRLEERVRDYLDERHKILSLSVPTKTGKTVLLRSLLDDPIWLSGGSIASVEDFWSQVADRQALYTSHQTGEIDEDSIGAHRSGSAGLPGLAQGEAGSTETTGRSRSEVRSRTRPVSAAAAEALSTNLRPLVIDDFHYVPQSIQLGIVRGLKELVFDGLPVILAAVPHRAYDAVRVEKEMTGRVEQLQIPFWEPEELLGIAHAGFDALGVVDDRGVAARLANESFSSPHLMQEFCREVCKASGIRKAADEPMRLKPPDWDAFFRSRASAASKTAFDRLTRGPRQRTDRKERQLKDSRVTDIYGLMLAAIAHTGPLTKLTYEELRAALREVTRGDPPQRHEITRVLEEMSKIARQEIEGEPVLDYDVDLSTLFISDPFFAYFLRWGAG